MRGRKGQDKGNGECSDCSDCKGGKEEVKRERMNRVE